MDEAFVDVTHLPGSPAELAASLRLRVHQATGCTASIGCGENRLVARVATRHAKPDRGGGFFHIEAGTLAAHMAGLDARDLPGVGQSTVTKLRELYGASTCAELQRQAQSTLQRDFGDKTGAMLWQFCRGMDTRPWEPRPQRHSVGAQVSRLPAPQDGIHLEAFGFPAARVESSRASPPAQAARGRARPPRRHFKNQSCCFPNRR